jgi:hypothetical protein
VSDLDPISVAWAAGIIEGEGHIQARYRSGPSTYGKNIAIKVRVVMTDRDVVEKLCQVFGVGKVSPYFPTTGLGKKPLYRWDAASRDAVVLVCDAIYPWMGTRRRRQIDQLRQLLAEYPPVTGKERLRRSWASRRAIHGPNGMRSGDQP